MDSPASRCTKSGSGSSTVAMVQPSESWARHDPTGSRAGSSAGWCLLCKAEVRTVLSVIPNVFEEQPFQVVFIEDDDMIQQVEPAAANPALGDAILPGTFEGNLKRMDA